ncbi:MAG: hypothetical protein RLY93_19585 [Sumerlaeia bacterium]
MSSNWLTDWISATKELKSKTPPPPRGICPDRPKAGNAPANHEDDLTDLLSESSLRLRAFVIADEMRKRREETTRRAAKAPTMPPANSPQEEPAVELPPIPKIEDNRRSASSAAVPKYITTRSSRESVTLAPKILGK